MLDFLLGLVLAGLLVRGWARGMVRELFDLVGLIVGIWVAFKLSAPLGDFLVRSFGVTPELARIGGGVALFFLFGVGLAIAARYLAKVMNLPGLSLVNRLGGALVATMWGVALLLVVLNLALVAPLPQDWDAAIEESTVAQAIIGRDALPQSFFSDFAPESALTALHSIQEIFGSNRAVPQGDEILEFPAALPDEVRQVRDEADVIFDEVNRHRAGLGLRPVQMSEGLRALAEMRAEESYVSGTLARAADCAAGAAAFGVRLRVCADLTALAGTALAAFDGIVESPEGQIELANPIYDRTGISVVDGPTGRILVIVLAG